MPIWISTSSPEFSCFKNYVFVGILYVDTKHENVCSTASDIAQVNRLYWLCNNLLCANFKSSVHLKSLLIFSSWSIYAKRIEAPKNSKVRKNKRRQQKKTVHLVLYICLFAHNPVNIAIKCTIFYAICLWHFFIFV